MKGVKPKILLVEDEANFGAVLKNYLELSEFSVVWAEDGNVGLSKFKSSPFDLCILDVMMPNKDGFTLAKEIKAINKDVPLIFLTAKSMKEDHIAGYKLGADDFITKPFDTELLLFKIRAILNRHGEAAVEDPEIEMGTLTFDSRRRLLLNNGKSTRLSPKESMLLHMLCKHANDVMPRQRALIDIWNNDDYFATRSMDVYIAKLRKHLRADPNLSIENIHGAGYQLNIPS
jgi:two-component system, OmpR family, response regulator